MVSLGFRAIDLQNQITNFADFENYIIVSQGQMLGPMYPFKIIEGGL